MDQELLEKLYHEPSRLAILCELLNAPKGMDFTSLKNACGLTDGNLSRHLKKLQENKIVKLQKAFVDNKPKTTVALTATGKKSFSAYIQHLEKIVRGAAKRIDAIEKKEKELQTSKGAAFIAKNKV